MDEEGAVAGDEVFGFHALELFLDGGVLGGGGLGVEEIGDLAGGGFLVIPEDLEDCQLGFGDVLRGSRHGSQPDCL